MKKRTIWLIIALCCVIIGTTIFVSGMSKIDWDFKKLGSYNFETNAYEIVDEFNKIEINAKTANIGLEWWLAIPYEVPGRYVNQFIGNVRTSSGETIDISSIKVEGNSYERDSWNHNFWDSTTTYIGGAYAIPVMDNKGSIKIDGKSLNFPL